jgi:small subunit ribosomal protein S6
MNEYELMYVLHPRLTADEVDQSIDRITGTITGPGGEIITVDRWGRRRLAYPIDRNLEGYYVLTTFRGPATVTQPLEAQLNIAEDVLRHLLIRGIIPYDGPPRDDRAADRGARPPRDFDEDERHDIDGEDDTDDVVDVAPANGDLPEPSEQPAATAAADAAPDAGADADADDEEQPVAATTD